MSAYVGYDLSCEWGSSFTNEAMQPKHHQEMVDHASAANQHPPPAFPVHPSNLVGQKLARLGVLHTVRAGGDRMHPQPLSQGRANTAAVLFFAWQENETALGPPPCALGPRPSCMYHPSPFALRTPAPAIRVPGWAV